VRTEVVEPGAGGISSDFGGRFAFGAEQLQSPALGHFIFGYLESNPASFALHSHFRSPYSAFKTEIQVSIPDAALLGYISKSEKKGIQAIHFWQFSCLSATNYQIKGKLYGMP
jgi:hypothetical protein